ncbi:MAG TPA: hypothetical protein PL042_01620 [Caldisericia bacterium]|nr:hypothetical protein [Caldisericia bacterium]
MTEGSFPKTDGDILYANEVNTLLQSFKNNADIVMLTTDNLDIMDDITAYKIADIFDDSTGHKNTISTGDTTAIYETITDTYICDLSLSTVITEPSFETVSTWTYSELDTSGNMSGGQDSGWSTAGTYSYRLRAQNVNYGDYGQILQSVNFDNIDFLAIDIRLYDESASYFPTARIYIDSDLKYDVHITEGTTDATLYIDCSSYTGNHNLIFKLIANVSGETPSGSFYIDNIRTYCSDSIVQSTSTTISGTYTYAFVKPKYYYPNPTGTSITHEISLDGGSTYSSETNDGTIISLSGLSGTSLICKTHLKTDSNGYHTPAIKGWVVMLL